jgi:hypothetical protein
MKFFIPISLVAIAMINSCSSDTSGATTLQEDQGVHFQGRDCLACHNIDLQKERNLFIGGTLFKDKNSTKVDDITTTCGGELIVNFLKAGVVSYSSKDYKVDTTKGNNGKGNLFILDRTNPPIAGDYIIQITDVNGNELASSLADHSFNGATYDNSKVDFANRHSCNSCHTTGGTTTPLFVQKNVNLCK